jgi:hypothetical protein
MGFFDGLENEALGKVMGSTSSPMATALLQLIQNQPGGLQGMVQSFHENEVLGSDQVKALAARAGISPEQAGSAIAQLLPGIVDKLTPNGEVPAHGNVMEMVGGLLQSLGKAS